MHILGGLKRFFHIQPSAFGCDVSDHSIRIVLLKEERGSLTLASFGTEFLPEGMVTGGAIANMPKTVECMQKAVSSAKGDKIKAPYVVVSLPEAQSFLRIIQLPNLSFAEIVEALKWEVEANIPLPLTEVYYDWEIAPKTSDQDHLDILVAASPKNFVDSYIQLFHASGLKPIAFEIDSLATARSVISSKEENPQPYMLIGIAYHRTSFIIYAGGLVRFTASVSIAGKNFSGSEVKNMVKNLAGYARQYMDFFSTHAAHTHLAHAEVKQVLICGDNVHTNGLASALAIELGIPVALANPWANILKPPLHEVPLLPYKDSLGYTVALGLALRGYQEFTRNNGPMTIDH